VIEARCAEVGATLLLEGRDFSLADRAVAVGGQTITVRGVRAEYEEFALPLFGEHTARNAAAAVVALEAFLGRALSRDAVREGLASVRSPGRLEVVARHPLLVLDGAHNPAGAQALAAALPEAFSWTRLHLVMAVFADKDLEGIVDRLAPLADAGYAAATASPRARPAAEVAVALATRGFATQAFPTVAEAVSAARAAADDGDLILVTGSLYTVADALRALAEES